VHVAYQIFGEGSIPFIGVPHLASNIEVQWEDPDFTRMAQRLSSFTRMVHFDKRGTGMSDRDVGIPTLEERVDDLRAVMDAVGFDRAFIAGISDGGSTAALFAAMHPERTLGIVLYGTAASFVARPDLPTAPTLEVWEQLTEAYVETWGSPATLSLPLLIQGKIGDDEFLRWINHYERQSASPGGLRALCQMNALIDLRAVLPTIRVPTLICHRKGDPAVNIEQGRYLAARIPGARLIELEGVDHVPWYGDCDALVDEMEEFITGVPPARGPPDSILVAVLALELVAGADAARALAQRLDRFRGRRLHDIGGTVFAAFDGPARAVNCANELRTVTRRIGIHVGVCDVAGDVLTGPALAHAAAIAAGARAGEVLVSQIVRDLVLPGSDFRFAAKGELFALDVAVETRGVESAPLAAAEPGARWKERYEPLEMIGEGSQGQVYRAMDHQHERVVALKVRAVGSAEERDALLSEARILLGLRPHQGVPLVRDDFFLDDRYVIVMDWIDGINLADVLEQRGDPGLATGTVVAYLAQVAAALDHLHSHSPPIVHGDVKPANCVLTADGRVVLVDFGISSWGGERRVGSGTRGYLAPEVAAGDLPTPAADIFGLAATTFALLDGVAPGAGGGLPSGKHPLARRAHCSCPCLAAHG
jgi:pimeloyl-ACP methyl ester carboxylesterase/predicted Ser/Thr protein kinase